MVEVKNIPINIQKMIFEDDLLKIPEYARMNRLRKIRPMIDFGFCEGTMGTMVIDSHHENLNTLYKEVLDNIKFQARDQRLAKLLDDLGC